jgi:5-deoxy-glucuronate isomerase
VLSGGQRAAAAPPYFPAGSLTTSSDLLVLTPEAAGWTYCGLRVIDIPPGGSRELLTGRSEVTLLPLSGSFEVRSPDLECTLSGRRNVFEGVSDFAYLPVGSSAGISSELGGRLAVPSARATRRLPARYMPAGDVLVEIRGAGSATRQVNNFLAPDVTDADRLMAVEVLTPAGNWSSYPPHKHDEERPGEARLEEIYYFAFRPAAGSGGPAGLRAEFGLQCLYTDDGEIQIAQAVADGDLMLIPRGYHGPSAAPPGYDMYYLNVLAGPGKNRSMAFCDDPRHAWIRGSWADQAVDDRVPLSSARTAPAQEVSRD